MLDPQDEQSISDFTPASEDLLGSKPVTLLDFPKFWDKLQTKPLALIPDVAGVREKLL
jgi:hypothetical protein